MNSIHVNYLLLRNHKSISLLDQVPKEGQENTLRHIILLPKGNISYFCIFRIGLGANLKSLIFRKYDKFAITFHVIINIFLPYILATSGVSNCISVGIGKGTQVIFTTIKFLGLTVIVIGGFVVLGKGNVSHLVLTDEQMNFLLVKL